MDHDTLFLFFLMVLAKHFTIKQVSKMLGMPTHELYRLSKKLNISWESIRFKRIRRLLWETDDALLRHELLTRMAEGRSFKSILESTFVQARLRVIQCARNNRSRMLKRERKMDIFIRSLFI